MESRDVEFLEGDFPSQGEVRGDGILYEQEDPLDDTQFTTTQEEFVPMDLENSGSVLPSEQPIIYDDDAEDEPSLRRSARGSVPRRRFDIEGEAMMVTTQEDDEPRTLSEALSSPDKKEWDIALQEELESMKTNHVWDLVDLPPGRRAIGNKWVFKVKRKADGSVERHKARLVAKGYTQQWGVDYEETFSPVVRIASIRLILAIVASMNLELHQMDVKTAFLNGELDEEIYMTQPEGFEVRGQEHKVCKLIKSIYGLKQSSRQWYLKFHQDIVAYGFTMVDEDHCVYVKSSGKKFMILSLYVDDILLASNDKGLLESTKGWLSSRFSMKDIGEASYILGIKILRDRSKRLLGLSQETYIKKILERFQMLDSKPFETPVAHGERLSLEMCPKTQHEKDQMTRVPYASAVGSLMYAMMCTRPDICQAVGLVSRYQSDPGVGHWKAVKRILRYLKGTMDYVLCYRGSELRLVGYSDADWGGDLDARKSTSGYVFMLGGGAITWSSSKQTCTALSTMEAEYVACSAAAQESVWLKRFLVSLGAVDRPRPVTLRCDSMAAIACAKDPKYHSKAKHIEIKYHFIREVVAKGDVALEHIPTNQMLADPMTKPLLKATFVGHVRNMGLRKWRDIS